MNFSLKPVKYEVLGHGFKHHSVYIESRGITGWVCAIPGSSVLNTDGDFEMEPLPSNRSEDFISRTRFETPEAALANFESHRLKFPDHW
jgi:hypothetical protein